MTSVDPTPLAQRTTNDVEQDPKDEQTAEQKAEIGDGVAELLR